MTTPDSNAQYLRMTRTPIPRLVTAMAVPTVVAMIITVLYNAADTFFVAQIDKSASAAVGVVYSLMAVLQAVGYGLGIGCGSLVSRHLGRREDATADMFASSAFFAALLTGALVGGTILWRIHSVLDLLGCSDTMMPYALPYARFVLLFAPVSCATFVLNDVLRAEGEARLAVWGLGIGGVLNLMLDPLLIFSFGMGTGGAALATGLSQCVSFSVLGSFFLRGKSIVHIRPGCVSRRGKDYILILTTGLPTICRQGLGSVAAAALNLQAVVYGDAAVAAITIANKMYVFVRNIVIGIGQGFQPVAGYNYGAGNKKRTWRAFTFATLVGTTVCVLSAVGLALGATGLMRWFCDDPQVVPIGRQTLYLGCAVMPLMAISTYVNQLYQSLGFRVGATLLASCRQGTFFLPLVWLLPRFWGCFGVQASQPAADLLTFVVSLPFLLHFYRRHLRETERDPAG